MTEDCPHTSEETPQTRSHDNFGAKSHSPTEVHQKAGKRKAEGCARREENNLFWSRKQVILLMILSYFPWQNQLFCRDQGKRFSIKRRERE